MVIRINSSSFNEDLMDRGFEVRNGVLVKYHEPNGVTRVIVPSGITKIGQRAFECCSMIEVIIPEGVTEIGECAFQDCSSLRSVKLPKSLKRIGDYAFYCCLDLTYLKIPDNIEFIGEDMNNIESASYRGYNLKTRYLKSGFLGELIYMIKTKRFDCDVPVQAKMDMAWEMLYKEPGNPSLISSVSEFFKELMRHAMRDNDTENVEFVCNYTDLINASNIDDMIMMAIDMKAYEIQVILTEFKRNEIGYNKKDWSL